MALRLKLATSAAMARRLTDADRRCESLILIGGLNPAYTGCVREAGCSCRLG